MTAKAAEGRPPVTAYVALGANLGDAAQTLRDALASLTHTPGIRLVKASSLYRTAPIESSGPDYLNAVAAVSTTLTAPDLLTALQAIENAAGRERPYRNAPRTLDLDLLLYGDGRIASPTLTVPHPRMGERAFVLVPLAEIAPEFVPEASLAVVSDQSIQRMPAADRAPEVLSMRRSVWVSVLAILVWAVIVYLLMTGAPVWIVIALGVVGAALALFDFVLIREMAGRLLLGRD